MTGEAVAAVFDAAADLVPELRRGMVDRRGTIDSENPSGETQLAADAWADERFEQRLTAIDGVGAYASEEREGVVDSGTGLSVAVDPLDGSSNLRSNNPTGSIIGVYDGDLPASGRDLVAAGYLLYGPVTTLVVAHEGSVRTEAVVDGQRRTVETDYTLPDDATVYGFGGGRDDWLSPFRAYADEVSSELKLRYSGAFIADVSQVLTYGGVFAYPALASRPEGKLRTQFEGAPMAYVVESAGARSSDGREELLDRPVEDLHERTPVHVGSAGYIDRLEATLAQEASR